MGQVTTFTTDLCLGKWQEKGQFLYTYVSLGNNGKIRGTKSVGYQQDTTEYQGYTSRSSEACGEVSLGPTLNIVHWKERDTWTSTQDIGNLELCKL